MHPHIKHGDDDSHDLEGAVWCVQELELLDGALRDGVERGATPAPLDQTDGLGCNKTQHKRKTSQAARTPPKSTRTLNSRVTRCFF